MAKWMLGMESLSETRSPMQSVLVSWLGVVFWSVSGLLPPQTIIEHTSHICHFARVEMSYIKTRQTTAATEYIIHPRHIARIEIAYVKVC